MVSGKFEGPVNVHAKRKTHYAIFIDGIRKTAWSPGTAPLNATARWRKLVASSAYADRLRRDKRQTQTEAESGFAQELRRDEPEAPAAGPGEEKEEGRMQKAESQDFIQDLYTERHPKIDIDDSLRLLAFPPRTLRK